MEVLVESNSKTSSYATAKESEQEEYDEIQTLKTPRKNTKVCTREDIKTIIKKSNISRANKNKVYEFIDSVSVMDTKDESVNVGEADLNLGEDQVGELYGSQDALGALGDPSGAGSFNGDEDPNHGGFGGPISNGGGEDGDDGAVFNGGRAGFTRRGEDYGGRNGAGDSFKMLRRPKDFSGSPSEARKWLQDYEFCAKVNGWTEQTKAARFPAFLAESARNWYAVAILNTIHERSFATIRQQFLLVFMPHSTKTTIANELDCKLQRAEEPVSNFIMDMRLLCLEYDGRMCEEEIVDKIRRRVLNKFEPQLSLANPRTISDLLTTCLLLEDGMKTRDKNNLASVVYKDTKCYSCNKLGHLSKDCRSRPTSSGHRTQARGRGDNKKNDSQQYRPSDRHKTDNRLKKTTTCYNCNGAGHYARDCPSPKESKLDGRNKPGKKPARQDAKTKSNVIAYAVKHDSMRVKVRINNHEVAALVDTGATMSIINLRKAESIGLTVEPGEGQNLRTANGTPLEDHGYASVKVRFIANNVEAVCDHRLVVADNLPVDMLMGLDLLKRMNVVVDCGADQIKIDRPKTVSTKKAIEGDCFCVERVTVPPRSTVLFEVLGPGGATEIVVTPTNREDSLLIPASVNKTENGLFTTIATNPSHAPVVINARSVMGKWSLALQNNSPRPATSTGQLTEGQANVVVKHEQIGEIEIGDHLNKEQRSELMGTIRRFSTIFSQGEKLGLCTQTSHSIILDDETPFKAPQRRRSDKERAIIREQVYTMLEKGIIRESKSPFSSPIVLVKKRDKSVRFCIDFRRLNAQTRKWVYPIPNQEKILNGAQGAQFITSLDLNSGYWQVPLDEDSKKYTAFNDEDEQYEYNCMPFGLVNASATFSKTMNLVMAGLIGDEVYVYLDDIVIMSSDWRTHMEKLENVLSRIKEANLTMKTTKCEFAKDEATVLGFKVSKNGVKPDPENVRAIAMMRTPSNAKEVRSFLGKVGFYRKFLPDMPTLSAPLVELTKKNNTFVWKEEHEEAFRTMIRKLLNSEAIGYYIHGLPLMIKSDASRIGIGALLLQLQEGSWRIISTTSRMLSQSEKNLGITELEGAALVEAVQKFRPYIYDQDVVVMVDHCALCALAKASTKPLNGKLARWAIALSEYKLNIKYQSGEKHCEADCLSRLPQPEFADKLDESRFCCVLVPLTDYRKHYPADEEAIELLSNVGNDTSITVDDGYVYKNNRLYVPTQFRQQVLLDAHSNGHPGIEQSLNLIRDKFYWATLFKDTDAFVRECTVCQRFKMPRRAPLGQMHSFAVREPFQMVALDFLGPLPETKMGNRNILVGIDVFSKFVFARATKSTTAIEAINFIKSQIVAYHGVPALFLADNASCFKAEALRKTMNSLGADIQLTTPHHHQGNAVVERVIQTFKDKLAMSIDDENDWDLEIDLVILSINATKHKTTKFSPYEVVYGRRLRLPNEPFNARDEESDYYNSLSTRLEMIRKDVIETTLEANKTSKQIYDRRHKDTRFEINDLVMVFFEPRAVKSSVKLVSKFVGPYKVSVRKPHDIYILNYVGTEKRRQRQITAHVSRLKKFYGKDKDEAASSSIAADEPDVESARTIANSSGEAEEDRTEISEPEQIVQELPPLDEPIIAEQTATSDSTLTSAKGSGRRKQTLQPRQIYLANWLFIALCLSQAANICDGRNCDFHQSSKVILTDTDYNVVSGMIQYDIDLKVQSPCHDLFDGLTTSDQLNAKLSDSCYGIFVEKIEKPLADFCGNNSQVRNTRLVGDVIAIGISSASLVVAADIKLNDIPYLRGAVTQLKTEAVSTNRRFDALSDNVVLLRETIVNDREATQHYLKTLSDRISLVKKEAEMNTAAAIVLAFYMEKVESMANDIATSASEWRYNKKVIYNLFNLIQAKDKYSSLISRYGKPLACSYTGETLKLSFRTHKVDERTTIFKTNTFKHYTGTKENLCLKEWNGPTLILANSSSKCFKTLSLTDLSTDQTIRTSCEGGQSLPEFDKLWKTSYCINSSENAIPKQTWVISNEGFQHIYCYTENISFHKKGECECPNYVFKIPDDESFQIGTYKYEAENMKISAHEDFRSTASSRILYQLDTKEETLILDKFQKGEEILGRVKAIEKAPSIEWIKDVPAFPSLKVATEGITGSIKWILENPDILYYGMAIIGCLFILSFVLPCVGLVTWVLGRACHPIRSFLARAKSDQKPLLPTRSSQLFRTNASTRPAVLRLQKYVERPRNKTRVL